MITVPAYAKINLFLDISARRSNGYHDIVSIMQSISLCDNITVSFKSGSNKNIEVFCDNDSIPCGPDNLVYKAADAFPLIGEIKITIEKNIPMSAGLGGGSADAAATLVALNKLSGNKLSVDELKTLGATLGADVPFCIEGGACIATGIGEILEKTVSMPDFPIVIARKGDGMSTPAAYKSLDQKFNDFVGHTVEYDRMELLIGNKKSESAEEYCKGLYNIFESVVECERPCVTEIKRELLSCGAVGAMMSGSGTAVFGIFNSLVDAECAVTRLKETGAVAFLCFRK